MSFGTQDDTDEVMNEINVTPLVDVTLVLLIIFIVTIPVMNHAVPVQLPRAASQKEVIQPETIRLSITADGSYHWNETDIADDDLEARLRQEAAKDPQPDLHIRGDRDVRYERVAKAMSAAQRAGIRKIGFVTDPDK